MMFLLKNGVFIIQEKVMKMNSKILNLIKQRLIRGEKRYGKENISSDGRDFVQEALEEALDCSVYLAGHLLEIQEKINLPKYQCTGDECI